MALKFDLVAIGDLNWDTFIVTPRIPGPDEEIPLELVSEAPGGDAANVATAFALLGGSSALIGAVGDDLAGQELLKRLQLAGVYSERVLVMNGRSSGRAFSLVEKTGQRRLLYWRGANAERKMNETDLAILQNTGWIYIADPLPTTVEKLTEWYGKGAVRAKLAFDPGSAGASRGLRYFGSLLKHVEVLFVNELEAKTLGNSDELMQAANVLLQISNIVVIKRGENGSLVYTPEFIQEVPAFRVNAVDTTGCGDAFNAAFLYQFIQGASLYEAAKWGNAAGAITATRIGAVMPTRKEILDLLGR
jgi:ribokinase